MTLNEMIEMLQDQRAELDALGLDHIDPALTIGHQPSYPLEARCSGIALANDDEPKVIILAGNEIGYGSSDWWTENGFM